MSRAPVANARVTCSSISRSALSFTSGWRLVFSSIGSQRMSDSKAFLYFSRNSSYITCGIRNRFDELHACPALRVRPATARFTTFSISEFGSTIKASLPPSSSTERLRYFPARAPTTLPAVSLPVRLTQAMYLCPIMNSLIDDGTNTLV